MPVMRDSTHLSERAARQAVEWAAAEGWNPGLDDEQRFVAADSEVFLATEHDGEIVGTVSCALYGPAYAFIGFYIVRADQRGRGVGTELFGRALARAGDRAIGLDGVLEQQPVYASLGFELAHRNERWRGAGGGTSPDGLVPLAEVAFDDLAAYDAAIFGAPRDAFLRTWIQREHALACVDGQRLRGYTVLRPCREGAKIGPLFADDADAAAVLLAGARAAAGDGIDVFLDVPHANPAAVELATEQLGAPVFETARMYRNGRPPEDIARVFGVTTFELG
jgi:GNAT superfamily N-acetyltransferase